MIIPGLIQRLVLVLPRHHSCPQCRRDSPRRPRRCPNRHPPASPFLPPHFILVILLLTILIIRIALLSQPSMTGAFVAPLEPPVPNLLPP